MNQHSINNSEELAHTGDERRLFVFTVFDETLDAVLPALRELTGETVEVDDLITYEPDPAKTPDIEAESALWLNTALTSPLESFEWGPEGKPKGQPVEFVPGEGLYIYEDSEA